MRTVALLSALALLLTPAAEARDRPTRPNIVVIVTDDMRWDELENMPNVRTLLQRRGVTIDNAFVSDPLCCPSRATILTGLYSDRTSVWNNTTSGGWSAFRALEPHALPVWLDDAGYRTALIGKYLNGYDGSVTPPGWDQWVAFEAPNERTGGAAHYYGYDLGVNGVTESHGHRPADYSTNVLGRRAVSFVRDAPTKRPFFLYFTPFGPHFPYTPAPADVSKDLSVGALPANVNETDVSDKPAYIRSLDTQPAQVWSTIKLEQERALLSVDRYVGRIVDAVEARGQLADTVFLFTSDNGLMVGSHRWESKQVPYEESIRVPMVWRWDGGGLSGGHVVDALVTNADIAPTLARIAGVVPSLEPQGVSLLAMLRGGPPVQRSAFPLEHVIQDAVSDGPSPPTYCGVRTKDAMYTHYATGEEEMYDLVADPLQLVNIAADPDGISLLASLKALAMDLCSPTPPGFSWT